MKQLSAVLIAAAVLTGCKSTQTSTTTSSTQTASVTPSASNYTPRIGLGVSTASRTCIAIHNGNLTTGTPITLISPIAPVTFTQATVNNVAQQACPISQNVDTTVSNYNVTAQTTLPKMTPLIAVVGTPTITVNGNNIAQADLDQNGHTETFRACSAADGIHLTVWNGTPLTGTPLWHGFYYEPNNAGVAPACTPGEIPAS